jgi:uncharacterized protein (TIGR02996 family)
MTRHEQLLTAVTANPQDDAARLAFAAHIRASEPDRATFIEEQVAAAAKRRAARIGPSNQPPVLLRRHLDEWTRMVAKYTRRVTFDRGFVAAISIAPDIFLSHGEWLMINFPIQVVDLVHDSDDELPVAELAASPLLARLEALVIRGEPKTQDELELERIRYPNKRQGLPLRDDDLERLLAARSLGKLVHVAIDVERVSAALCDRLARSPQVRKLLTLRLGKDGPGQRYADTGRDDMEGRAVHEWTGVSTTGKALEKKFGYLPWLHPEDNNADPLDAAWYVAHGVLPHKPPGSWVGG